ncbi:MULTISPECIES: adenylate/guanylate cyclase domain-containing protein [unclassified Devosia]|jgi:adenylate cyclase|uniref:adenylate/guanylate cyclase domain-containing protein n=1 Tax=unclassified Devosia TaxID=196773 RepID=UPI00086CB233|nr:MULTISPECIES: adenylate/guanylate cyclase domain-containing protein [unclassified Devosia]MBN9361013.1 adenylate/guanylate cyclase domain-containing protein [Devosia sp.]ODS85296.1 MAG: adenylate cyclase [Devosia sp. SCN 66-27]OJV48975.1 MAG: adenylate/guanylate cyclase domain-containing protein [Burkholderiales bacterium 68-10]OJX22947.1 MAG: adenylate/guanylate cyclase domain-containing protein [Devosia sp. 66-14]
MEQVLSRRLAAVLCADIAGYSALIGADESGTVAALKGHQTAVLQLLQRHGGRVVDLAGDGIVAEFSSTVSAVEAAVAMQALMAERNAEVPVNKRMIFRIGVNQGDVVHDDAHIYGDGINIAARLQQIAEPGGVYVSSKVFEEVRDRMKDGFRDLGERVLKNIARPVRVFEVVTGTARSTRPPEFGPVTPRKPSVAVLPFDNMGGDSEQEYFADGVVEDIITALSRFRDFAVVARNSSFVYKGRAVDVRQVGRELGVRYVLEGSVRRSRDRLRITAQLVDAMTGAHLWADKFDGKLDDVFEFQDQITLKVASVAEPTIRWAEIERSRRERPDSVEAYDLYLRALPMHLSQTRDANAEAIALLLRAIELEPNNPTFLVYAGNAMLHRSTMGWAATGTDDTALGIELVERALANARDDAVVLSLSSMMLIHNLHDYDRGLVLTQRAVESNPNNLTVMIFAGITHLHLGSIDGAIAFSEHAIRLSPSLDGAHWPLTAISHAQMIKGSYEEALVWAKRSISANPSFVCSYWMLVAANAHLGRMDEARRHLATLRRLSPGVTIAQVWAAQPQKDPSRVAAILDGLRLAGVAEA